VLREAQHLLDSREAIPDPDRAIRRDLRHLRCYAIDGEGASEVDDAISVEDIGDGRERLWVHIADVSRWVRPGSALCREAERRMGSIYMPDERIRLVTSYVCYEVVDVLMFDV
jgi:exoribonuclease R